MLLLFKAIECSCRIFSSVSAPVFSAPSYALYQFTIGNVCSINVFSLYMSCIQRPSICTISIHYRECVLYINHYRGYFSRRFLSQVLDEQGVVVVVDDVVLIRRLLQLRVLLLG